MWKYVTLSLNHACEFDVNVELACEHLECSTTILWACGCHDLIRIDRKWGERERDEIKRTRIVGRCSGKVLRLDNSGLVFESKVHQVTRLPRGLSGLHPGHETFFFRENRFQLGCGPQSPAANPSRGIDLGPGEKCLLCCKKREDCTERG